MVEEFYNKARVVGEQAAVEHFLELNHKQQYLSNQFGGQARRHGSSPFNPKAGRRSGRSILWDRFLNMDRREQDVVEFLAQKIRDTYEPHHQGRPMEPWREMDDERKVKWIEMAVISIRELDKLGLMR